MRGWGIGLVVFLLTVSPVSAAFSFQLTSVEPSTISSTDQDVKVSLSLSDLPSPSYFRVAFQKASGESYFGYLKNNSESWVKIKPLSSDCKDYFFVSDTSTASADLTLKVGSDQPVEPGAYFIKAHRFTSTSCSSSEAQNTQSITLNFSSISPTAAPTFKPVNTKAPTLVPTLLPTQTLVPAHSLVPITSSVPTDYPSPVPSSASVTPSVLGQSTSPSTPTHPFQFWSGLAFIVMGGLSLIGAFVYLGYHYSHRHDSSH